MALGYSLPNPVLEAGGTGGIKTNEVLRWSLHSDSEIGVGEQIINEDISKQEKDDIVVTAFQRISTGC